MMDIVWTENEEDGMKLNRHNDVLYLTFPDFDRENWIRHGFSTRLGGVSREHLSSMNLGFGRGDDENVRTNFALIADAIGFRPEDMVFSDQTHTVNVRRVDSDDRGRGFLREKGWTDVDGLVTDDPGVVLTTFYADCVPLFFIDPEHRAIGLSHSGWRGTASRMAQVTISRMREEFGSDPRKMKAAIGPSICRKCYEVSEDVAVQFPEAFVKEKKNGKFLLDLQGTNRAIMIECGIPMSSISMPGICTACNPDFLYSHRASHGLRGSLAGFLEIIP